MTVIDLVKQIVTEYPQIQQFTNYVSVDFTKDDDPNYGLSPVGDSLVSKTILGHEKRQINFSLYAVDVAYEDYNRLNNSNFLLELGYWLDEHEEVGTVHETSNKKYNIILDKLRCANAMMFQLQDNDINKPVMYQLQITANYTKSEVVE